MKACQKCGEEKPLDGFYKSGTNDGRDNTCKECRKARVRQNRAEKVEYYREYDRRRFQEDPKVRQRHRRYQKTEAGKASMAASQRRWLERNRDKVEAARNLWCENNAEKRAAHIAVGNAVRDKRLEKPECCEACGASGKRLDGHHDDYAKPLEVRWLCRPCHVAWHRLHGEAISSKLSEA